MSETEILIGLIVAVSFFVQSAFGFGGGLVAVPLASLVIGTPNAVSVALVFQALMGLQLFSLYKQIDWRAVGWMPLALLAGVAAGLFLFTNAPATFLQALLGFYLIFYVGCEVFALKPFSGFLRNVPDAAYSGAVGLVCGAMQAMIGISGPPIVAYLNSRGLRPQPLRATIVFLLYIGVLASFIPSLFTPRYTGDVLHLVLWSLPFFAVAVWAGDIFSKKLSPTLFRAGLLIILAVAALFLLYKAL